jgi:hypothetical protein
LSRDADPAPRVDDGLTLEELDADGALLEAIDSVYGDSRADLLRKAAFGGAALLGVLARPPDATGAPKKDTAVLKFDLVFEYLQSSFYLGAVRVGTVQRMAPEKARWAHVLGAHEVAHVAILRKVLGRDAVKKPFFNFRGVTESESAFTSPCSPARRRSSRIGRSSRRSSRS